MVRRQARSPIWITGRRDLHDLGSRACLGSWAPWQIATTWTSWNNAEVLGLDVIDANMKQNAVHV